MLPNVAAHNGVDLFGFDQATDFPIGIASTTQDGACSGLSLHWIKKHKLGQLAAFRATMLLPSSIRDVENFQSNLGNSMTEACARAMDATGLSQGVSKDITTGMTADRVAQSLALTQGYELMSFVSGGDQHTVAIGRIGADVDFFDSNHGCARFNSRDDFKAWFAAQYWNAVGGPDDPGPCTRVMVQSFI